MYNHFKPSVIPGNDNPWQEKRHDSVRWVGSRSAAGPGDRATGRGSTPLTLGCVDEAGARQTLVRSCTLERRGVRNRFASRRYLSIGDAFARRDRVAERWLLLTDPSW